MASEDFKDLAKGTASEKILKNKAFKIASNRKYDGYQRDSAFMVYKVFDKKIKGSGISMLANIVSIQNKIKQNQQLAEELHNPIIRKF